MGSGPARFLPSRRAHQRPAASDPGARRGWIGSRRSHGSVPQTSGTAAAGYSQFPALAVTKGNTPRQSVTLAGALHQLTSGDSFPQIVEARPSVHAMKIAEKLTPRQRTKFIPVPIDGV